LNDLIGGIVEDRVVAPPVDLRLPAGRVMLPWPWKAGTMVDGSTKPHPVASYFLPTVVDPTTIVMEPDEVIHDSRLTSVVTGETVDRQKGRTGLHSSLRSDSLRGQPRLVVINHRIAVWGELREQVKFVSFKFEMLAPRLASAIDDVRMTQYALGHTGVFLVAQVRSEWVRALVMRDTVTERSKHFLDRMIMGKGGTTRAVGVEIELPGHCVLNVELFRAENEQGPLADEFMSALRDAVPSWPGGRAVSASPVETDQTFTNAVARYSHYEVKGSVPASLPDPMVDHSIPTK
jgi:hypothetical protein